MANLQFVITLDSAGAIQGLRAYNAEQVNLGKTATAASSEATSAFDRIEATLNKAKSAMIGFIAAVAFAEAIRGVRDFLAANIEFEDSFSQITRVVQASNSELADLRERMLDLSTIIPVNVNDLNNMAGRAAQMGVPMSDLVDTMKILGEMSVAANLPLQETTEMMVRFADEMGLPLSQLGHMADVLTLLGNSSLPATESEILKFNLNIGGAARAVGMTSDQVSALAAALISTGLHSEKAGSSISKVLEDMLKDASANNIQFQNMAQIAGVTMPGAFAAMFKSDPATALLKLLEGLKAIQDSGGNTVAALNAIGEKNIRVVDVMLRGADASGLFARAMDSLADASNVAGFAHGKLLAATQDVSHQIESTVNAIKAAVISLSSEFSPSVLSAIGDVNLFVQALKTYQAAIKATVEVAGTFAAVFAAFKFGEWVAGIALVGKTLANLTAGFTVAYSSVGAAGLIAAMTELFAPVVLVIAGIAGLISIVDQLNERNKNAAAIKSAQVTSEELYEKTLRGTEETYAKYGITLSLVGLNQQQVSDILKDASPLLQAAKDKTDAAAAAAIAHAANIKLASDATDKFNKKVAEMVSAITEGTKKQQELTAALNLADKQGIDSTATFDKYGKAALALAEQQTAAGTAIDPVLQKYADLQIQQEAGAEATKESNAAVDEQIKQMIAAAAATDEESRALEEANTNTRNMLDPTQMFMDNLTNLTGFLQLNHDGLVVWGNSWDPVIDKLYSAKAAADAQITTMQNLLKLYQTLPDGSLSPVLGPGAITVPSIDKPSLGSGQPTTSDWEKWSKDGQSSIDAISGRMSRMFTDMISSGTNFWTALSKLGEDFIGSFVGQFAKKMVEGLLAPWKDTLGRWTDEFEAFAKQIASSLKDHLGAVSIGTAGGAIGGGLLGGGTGAAAGGIAGGATSAVISAAGDAAKAGATGILGSLGGLLGGLTQFAGPIGAVVGTIVGAVAGLFGGLHQEANKFVQNVQNPFGQGVSNLIDSLQKASDAGTLTTKMVDDTRTKIMDMWKAVMDAMDKVSPIIKQQAMNTLQPFLDSVLGMLDNFTTAAASEQYIAAVNKVEDTINKAADGFESFNEALYNLHNQGISDSTVLKYLGGDLTKFYDALVAIGMPIPDDIQRLHDLQSNMTKQAQVETDLASVHTQLVSDLNSKINLLNQGIQTSQSAIAGWNKDIDTTNANINTARNTLSDTAYWQKVYTDAIKATQDALTKATADRTNIETQIASLTTKVQQNQLQSALDWAKASGDNVLIQQAQADLTQFQTEQQQKQYAADAQNLANLQAQLPIAVQAEKDAKAAYDAAAKAATDAVTSQKQQLADYITTQEGIRSQLQASIAAEKDRISAMQADIDVSDRLLTALGATRQGEIANLNASITSLYSRGVQLEAERSQLSTLTGVAKKTTDVFGTMGDAFTTAADKAVAAAAALAAAGTGTGKPVTSAPSSSPAHAAPATPTQTVVPTTSSGGSAIPQGYYQMTPFGIRSIDASTIHDYNPASVLQNTAYGFVPAFASGTDFVPRDMLAMVHRGERIIPASQNTGGTGNVSYSPSVNVNFTINGPADRAQLRRFVRDEILPQITEALDVNSRGVVGKISNALIQQDQTKKVYK